MDTSKTNTPKPTKTLEPRKVLFFGVDEDFEADEYFQVDDEDEISEFASDDDRTIIAETRNVVVRGKL
jgi:hypothetical protein